MNKIKEDIVNNIMDEKKLSDMKIYVIKIIDSDTCFRPTSSILYRGYDIKKALEVYNKWKKAQTYECEWIEY